MQDSAKGGPSCLLRTYGSPDGPTQPVFISPAMFFLEGDVGRREPRARAKSSQVKSHRHDLFNCELVCLLGTVEKVVREHSRFTQSCAREGQVSLQVYPGSLEQKRKVDDNGEKLRIKACCLPLQAYTAVCQSVLGQTDG